MHTAPGMRLVTRQRELYFAGYSRAVTESAEGPGLCSRSLCSSRAGRGGEEARPALARFSSHLYQTPFFGLVRCSGAAVKRHRRYRGDRPSCVQSPNQRLAVQSCWTRELLAVSPSSQEVLAPPSCA